MSLQDRVIESMIQHIPLTLGFLAMLWFTTPHLLKKTLANGGGKLIQDAVEKANLTQSAKHHEYVKEALEAHEEREFQRYDEIAGRLRRVEGIIMEGSQ